LSRGRDKLDVPPPDHKPSNRLCDYSHTASRSRPGEKTLDAQIADGTAKVEGDIRINRFGRRDLLAVLDEMRCG
jgi:hypothetical protein